MQSLRRAVQASSKRTASPSKSPKGSSREEQHQRFQGTTIKMCRKSEKNAKNVGTWDAKKQQNVMVVDGVPITHWRELFDPSTCRLKRCRRPGSPAGSFIKAPWWHHCLHDEYERINFWSHFLPGMMFIITAMCSLLHLMPGGHSLALFGLSTGLTHVFSALGHLYPDSHTLERLDHVGIVLTIIGTPVTALMALEHDHLPTPMIVIGLGLLCAAFLPPTPRVCGFISLGSLIAVLYGHKVMSPMLVIEIFLYLCGAAAFLRNEGHERPTGFSDHHFLHYFVTVAGCIHVKLILSLI